MFYICTTAINRPVLHTQELMSFKKFFDSMDSKFFENLTWIINIDIVQKLKNTLEETQLNYKNTINFLYPKSKIVFLNQSQNPSFKMAVKKIADYLKDNFKQGDKFLWLEDDWNYIGDVNLKSIIDYLDDYTSFHMYWKCREDNLYPIIRGYYEGITFINTILSFTDNNDDPECHLMKKYPKIQKDFNIYIIKNKLDDILVTGGMRSNIKRYTSLGSKINYVLSFDDIELSSKNKIRHIAYNKTLCKDLGKGYMMLHNLVKWTNGNQASNYDEKK